MVPPPPALRASACPSGGNWGIKKHNSQWSTPFPRWRRDGWRLHPPQCEVGFSGITGSHSFMTCAKTWQLELIFNGSTSCGNNKKNKSVFAVGRPCSNAKINGNIKKWWSLDCPFLFDLHNDVTPFNTLTFDLIESIKVTQSGIFYFSPQGGHGNSTWEPLLWVNPPGALLLPLLLWAGSNFYF